MTDEEGRLLLSLRMLSISGLPRAELERNDWMIVGGPEDVESPPNGASLRITYSNGDATTVRFREWKDEASFGAVHPRALALEDTLRFPLVTVEIEIAVGGTNIRIGPKASVIGEVTMTAGGLMSHCLNGFLIGSLEPDGRRFVLGHGVEHRPGSNLATDLASSRIPAAMDERSGEPKHDLETLLSKDLAEMASAYERIRDRTHEEPGRAGDEGEEVWASLFREWLPDNYTIVTRGRLLNIEGVSGPQLDVIILRPGYPRRLLSEKLYLTAGVAAVFECKNTLNASYIKDAFTRAQEVNALIPPAMGTPLGETVPAIPFGLLALGHSWTVPSNDVKHRIDDELGEALLAATSPADPPTLVCVANLTFWGAHRTPYEGPLPELLAIDPQYWDAAKARTGVPDEGAAMVGYMRHADDTEFGDFGRPPPNAIAQVIAHVSYMLAHRDASLRPLAHYFRAAGLLGSGVGVIGTWFPLSDFSSELRAGLPGKLTNGVWDSEWANHYAF
ncbi:MAG: DUF6602 domain-containing protein [Nocardioidaceae bacterium]